MDVGPPLLLGLALLATAALPVWPYSRGWDLRPLTGFTLIMGLALALMLTGRL
ncbi:MAG TPA: DUF3309 family protein [Microvirga sp.]|nr:DUF3309 family protein [Microvirga sp.]